MSRSLAAALALGVNLVSHPALWAVGLQMSNASSLLLAETAVAALEGFAIFLVTTRARVDQAAGRLRWSMLTAGGVNALSLVVGVVAWPVLVTT